MDPLKGRINNDVCSESASEFASMTLGRRSILEWLGPSGSCIPSNQGGGSGPCVACFVFEGMLCYSSHKWHVPA